MTLKKRHKQANEELKSVAVPYLRKHGAAQPVLRNIGRRLGVTDRTVKNYVDGYGKDGFLTEAITKEFQLLNADTL
jgi:predicted transcriptional regulator